ncbi:hypothetical protein BX600DRAFT_526519 [Xylariales sp. PMI_506]|nr:hypothetical protein BX600DRAFT_526519 [Xylariales sp. PMI_506]
MKGPRSFGQMMTVAVALSSTVSAWPSWLPNIDALIVRRADATTTTAATKTSTTASATGTTATANEPTTTNLNTGGQTKTATGTGTADGTGSSNSTAATTHTTYDAVDPAGGITMMTPATTTGTILYRIGDTITWVWNYTSLQATPTAIDVLVSCSIASETWTLTQNMSFDATGSYTWDTNQYKQTAVDKQLVTEMYTLIIYDAESSISATAEAGYLDTYDTFKFGMYEALTYSNLSQWKCVTCSAASSDLDRKALGFAVSMAMITILSFTWFVAGFGALL